MTDENVTDITERTKERAQSELVEGKFNFLDFLTGREYPTEDVEIYLDERAGYLIHKLEQEAARTTDGEQANIIHEQIAFQREKAQKSRFVLHLEGISVEEYDKVVDLVTEAFPVEYTESRNPLTFGLERTPKESPDREQMFRTHLWAKFIRTVTGPNGGVDDDISPEWVAVFMNHAPLIALGRVEAAVQELRMTSDWMDALTTEDFLAKS
jgi:hypothetical protein